MDRTLPAAINDYIQSNPTTESYRSTILDYCYMAITIELFNMTPKELKQARLAKDGVSLLFTSDELELIGVIEEKAVTLVDGGAEPLDATMEVLANIFEGGEVI